ncbi:unnamed protein product [Pleuronectes platessa]|uniref:Uncharacterized protein n=1 Tax=Pleuronectes platessa TaxID=8262 RepID=A0A9N7UHD3_PLEPL|nr:unnamed protein product [Pleuronectes platessa]
MPPSCWPLWNSHVTIKRLPRPNLLFRASPQTLICIIGTTSVERVKEQQREGRTERGVREEEKDERRGGEGRAGRLRGWREVSDEGEEEERGRKSGAVTGKEEKWAER